MLVHSKIVLIECGRARRAIIGIAGGAKAMIA
jgi:hypothetical protein